VWSFVFSKFNIACSLFFQNNGQQNADWSLYNNNMDNDSNNVSESLKKRARSPHEQQEQPQQQPDNNNDTRAPPAHQRGDGGGKQRRQGDVYDEQSVPPPPTSSSSTYRDRSADVVGSEPSNDELMAEYRLLLARQETLQDQIRWVETRLAQRRWLELSSLGVGGAAAAVGIPGLSVRGQQLLGDRFYTNDQPTSLLEQARADFLRRESQVLLLEQQQQQQQRQGAAAAAGRSSSAAAYNASSSVPESDTWRLLQERELLLARLAPAASGGGGGPRGGVGLPDRLLSSEDVFRRGLYSNAQLLGQLQPTSMETTIEDLLMAARSRGGGGGIGNISNGIDRFAPASLLRGANQQTALSRSRLEESLGRSNNSGSSSRSQQHRRNNSPQPQIPPTVMSPPHRYGDSSNSDMIAGAGAFGPADQMQLLQQIERQRRINESLIEQARMRDLATTTASTSSAAMVAATRPPAPAVTTSAATTAAATASSHQGKLLRDNMRESPPGSTATGRDFRAGVLMSVAADREKLSAFQALIRQSLEYFEATDDDVLTSVQGRRQKIRLGQSKIFVCLFLL
jgi:hypothetical protein